VNRTRFVIRYNTVAADVCCHLCGETIAPHIGPELSLADTTALVCWKCGRRHAPELVAMLAALNQYKAEVRDTLLQAEAAALLARCDESLAWASEWADLQERWGIPCHGFTTWAQWLSSVAGSREPPRRPKPRF
jgi:hypothetical protein